MLKITVSPLAIRNSSMPNSTPLSVEMTISSSTAHLHRELTLLPLPACGERSMHIERCTAGEGDYPRAWRAWRLPSPRPSPRKRGEGKRLRPVHLAGGRQRGLWRVDPGDQLPAPAGLLLVEGLLLGALAERSNIHGLEELVIVLPHHAFAAVVHIELHALERLGDLDRLERLRLVGSGSEHPHLVDGARIEQAEIVFRPERLFERIGGR